MTGYTLHHGDCLEVLPTLEADSVDTCITDPPYGLEFMGKDWDHGVPGVRFWREVYRVLKPGAMLLAFGGTRTHHRLMVAIEDAGFEIRDCLMWLYGSGFPKSHDISKAIDRAAGAEREVVGYSKLNERDKKVYAPKSENGAYNPRKEPGVHNNAITAPATPAAQQWHGYGTALKPAWEPIILAMKPRAGTFAENALAWGVAGLWVDGARVGADTARGDRYNGKTPKGTHFSAGNNGQAKPERVWDVPQGRWPANVVLDGEAARLLDEQAGERHSGKPLGRMHKDADGRTTYGSYSGEYEHTGYGDTGGASRFFYCAKSSRRERNEGLPKWKEYKLREDLTDEQREYVMSELQKLGIA